MIFKRLKEDIEAIREKDPAAHNLNAFTILLTYPGLQALIFHRLIHKLYLKGWFNIARIASHIARFLTGVEIHPGATIGRRVVIDHGMGVVIGETANIGDDVLIYQGAVLGGTGKHTGKRHPTVEEKVVIGAHAIILGPITIGKNSRIGAGAIVVEDVPPNSTVVNPKSSIVRINGKKIDPLEHGMLVRMATTINNFADKLEKLEYKLEALEQQITHLKKEHCE